MSFIKTAPAAVSLFFIILFSYAAVIKIAGFATFRAQLGQSPGLEGYGNPAAYVITALLVGAAAMLCYTRSRVWGLWLSLAMVTVSAAYIGVLLLYAKKLPCNCIGLFENMTWTGNLLLNAGLMITALAGILLLHEKKDSDTEKDMIRD